MHTFLIDEVFLPPIQRVGGFFLFIIFVTHAIDEVEEIDYYDYEHYILTSWGNGKMTKEKAWKIEIKNGEIYVGSKTSFYNGFWFELGFLVDGSFGLKHKRWNDEKGRLPRFPKYISRKLKEIGFTKFQHTDGTIHYL